MRFSALLKLDEIDQAQIDSDDLVFEATELMGTFIQGVEELNVLVERFGNSTRRAIVGPLTFFMVKAAEKPPPEMFPLLVELSLLQNMP